MILMQISGPRYLNMDRLVDAQVVGGGKVLLKFSAPTPAGVGASSWSFRPYEVTLTGADAEAAARWLDFMKFSGDDEPAGPGPRLAPDPDDDGGAA